MNAYGVMAGVLILVTSAPLYLAAYLLVLNPAIGCTWPACHSVLYSARCLACQLLYFIAFCVRIIKLMVDEHSSRLSSSLLSSNK